MFRQAIGRDGSQPEKVIENIDNEVVHSQIDEALVDLVLHEVYHNTFFAKGAHATAFNESLATFVGSRAAIEFFAARSGDAERLAEIERQAIVQALRKHDFNRTETAKALGISRRALQYKLKEYGLIEGKPDSGVME